MTLGPPSIEAALAECEADLDAAIEAMLVEEVVTLSERRNALLADAIKSCPDQISAERFVSRSLERNEILLERMSIMKARTLDSLKAIDKGNQARLAYDA